MPKPFVIQVFGKPGCDKCDLLNDRLDRLLAEPEWEDFEKQYCNVETEDGLVALCEAECIDPRRIPALLVLRWDDAAGRYEPVQNPNCRRPEGESSRLYSYLGLQTDYSEKGRGVITPAMIVELLKDVRASQPAPTREKADAPAGSLC